MQEKGGDYGVATACVGGGQGAAVVIERSDLTIRGLPITANYISFEV